MKATTGASSRHGERAARGKEKCNRDSWSAPAGWQQIERSAAETIKSANEGDDSEQPTRRVSSVREGEAQQRFTERASGMANKESTIKSANEGDDSVRHGE